MRKDNIQVQLSIVSPVYKAEVLIPFLVAEIKKRTFRTKIILE